MGVDRSMSTIFWPRRQMTSDAACRLATSSGPEPEAEEIASCSRKSKNFENTFFHSKELAHRCTHSINLCFGTNCVLRPKALFKLNEVFKQDGLHFHDPLHLTSNTPTQWHNHSRTQGDIYIFRLFASVLPLFLVYQSHDRIQSARLRGYLFEKTVAIRFSGRCGLAEWKEGDPAESQHIYGVSPRKKSNGSYVRRHFERLSLRTA
mmetsp:Transcript_31626/g.66167  ORF Transcript_31626/g.66167 Transcript_31626/m.66167 type:complete len:206 (-) Transcript_31626:100-717(-)